MKKLIFGGSCYSFRDGNGDDKPEGENKPDGDKPAEGDDKPTP